MIHTGCTLCCPQAYPLGRSPNTDLNYLQVAQHFTALAFPFLLTGSQFFMSRISKHKKVQQTQLQDEMTYSTCPIGQPHLIRLFLVLTTVQHFSLCTAQEHQILLSVAPQIRERPKVPTNSFESCNFLSHSGILLPALPQSVLFPFGFFLT